MLFRQTVFYALLAGILSGLLLTAVQTFQVIPIILAAEQYESVAVEDDHHAHDHHAHDHHAHDHHTEDAWAPTDGMQRTAFTALANILTALGFALVLMVAMMAAHSTSWGRNLKFDWRQGLLWGAAGYMVFWLAPAIGLPPEIPLQAAPPLEHRQLWWILTVVCTAGGLAGLAFTPSPWRWMAPALLAVPHIVGAPHTVGAMFPNQPPAVSASLEQLAQQFVGAAAIANGALWLALGLISAWAVQRMITSMKRVESSDADVEPNYSA